MTLTVSIFLDTADSLSTSARLSYFEQIAWKIGPQVRVYALALASWAALPPTFATNYDYNR